jgi:hypothetical protein
MIQAGVKIYPAEARILRAVRAALRDLDSDAYKALLQLVLLKSPGQEIRLSFASFEEITGVSARRCAAVIKDLTDRKLISVIRGRPLGRGQGFGPMRLIIRPLPTQLDEAPEEFVVLDPEQMQSGCGTDAEPMQLQENEAQPECIGSASALQAESRQKYSYTQGGGGGLPRACAIPPTPPWADGLTPEVVERLAAVAGFRVNLLAKDDTRDRWIRETDGLTDEQVREVFALRAEPVSWPSEFSVLRKRWAKRHGAAEAKRAALDADARQSEAAAKRKADDDRRAAEQAQASAEAKIKREALAGHLGAGWARIGKTWGTRVPWVFIQRTTYPLALAEGRLVVHVGSEHDAGLLRAIGADFLAHAAAAYEQPCQHLDLIINGHPHPTATALPAACQTR